MKNTEAPTEGEYTTEVQNRCRYISGIGKINRLYISIYYNAMIQEMGIYRKVKMSTSTHIKWTKAHH